MKMNVTIIKVFLAISVLCCSTACTREVETVPYSPSVYKLGDLHPVSIIDMKTDSVYLHFLSSVSPYFIKVNNEKGQEKLAILLDAKKKRSLVEISVYKGTREIADVIASPQQLSDDFRKTLHFTNNPSELQTSRRANLSALDEDPLIIPDVATLNLLFDKMNDPSIPFAYAVDGCYARAHWMRKILNDNGYECEKLVKYP